MSTCVPCSKNSDGRLPHDLKEEPRANGAPSRTPVPFVSEEPEIQPPQSKPRRETDTSPFVGHACLGCGERVLVNEEKKAGKGGDGFWRVRPDGSVQAWHLKHWLEAGKP